MSSMEKPRPMGQDSEHDSEVSKLRQRCAQLEVERDAYMEQALRLQRERPPPTGDEA